MKRFRTLFLTGWHFTIRTQLATLITLLIAAISLFIFIYFPSELEHMAIKAIAGKAKSVAEMTAFSVSPGLLFEDLEAVEEAFEGTKRNRDLVYIVVIDNSGQVFATSDRDRAELAHFTQAQNGQHISQDGTVYRVMSPILNNGREIGQLYLGLSLEGLNAEINRSRVTIAFVSFMVFIVGLIAVYGISTVITGPLRQMVKTVEQIAEGDLTQRADISSQYEVAHLAKSFNLMVKNLESAHLDLENANRNLEKRAQELHKEINERKRAEEGLKIYAEKLERSNQELQSFAYVASHDLQEPLRKIQAFGDRLNSKYNASLDERGQDYLQRMQNAAGRMQTLINDLLSFSRVTTKAQPFVPVNLAQVAREVITDLEVRIEETGGRAELGDLPTIDADALQIRQLFQNLIGNAFKFRREGVPPVVKVESAIRGNGAGAMCQIRVIDNGIGFDEKYIDRIFGIFQRLHSRGAYEGTGVGLAICRKIVDRHGGSITAKSSPGQGATFIVTLPIQHREGEESQ